MSNLDDSEEEDVFRKEYDNLRVQFNSLADRFEQGQEFLRETKGNLDRYYLAARGKMVSFRHWGEKNGIQDPEFWGIFNLGPWRGR